MVCVMVFAMRCALPPTSRCTYVALMKERNTYLDALQQIHDAGDRAGWEKKNELMGRVRATLYSDPASRTARRASASVAAGAAGAAAASAVSR